MGLFQKAIETYDAMNAIVGAEVDNMEPLAMISHMITTAKIEITIDKSGNFVKASAVDQKISIPCTEKSSGRSSAPAAHPLCDKVDYVCEIDPEKHGIYLNELKKWKESQYGDKKLDAIYQYLTNSNVLNDCKKSGVITYDDNGKIKNNNDIVTWRVVGLENSGAVYEDRNLQEKYVKYYTSISNNPVYVCMASGKSEPIAIQHLKGVSNFAGNAKLISSNDNTNYTYRGRFSNDREAMTMSYESSQKAHNALKWLVSNYGVSFGNKRMICWNPKGKSIPKFNNPLLKRSSDVKLEPSDYKEQLKKTVAGYKNQLPVSELVILAAFEAATSGRLSVTYYNELKSSDFLDRLYYWDSTCIWNSYKWGVCSPTLYQIINSAFGTQRGDDENSSIETDSRILGQQMQRLVRCRIDKSLFPVDIMRALAVKAQNLQIYSKVNREELLFIACAVIKKCRFDNYKEEWKMSLEENKHDRSYQYGRLLAVMEKIEKDTYDKDEGRETNAIRLQAFFVQRPQTAYSQIMTQLKTGYYPRLSISTRTYYDKLIGEIIEEISKFRDDEIGKPLTETYLMGYYLQKNALYAKKTNIDNGEE